MKVGLDVDGVLANFNGTETGSSDTTGFIKRFIDVTGKDLFPPRPFDIPTWHYPQHYGYTEEEAAFPNGPVWSSVIADPEFWYTLYPYKGVPEFLSRLDSGAHDFYFITNRAGVAVKAQTESWLEFHGFGLKTPNFGFPTVLIASDKGAIAKGLKLDLYIDDNTDNCLAVNHDSPKTKMIMLARPWNTPLLGIPRFDSLAEFEAAIEIASTTSI